MSDTMQSQDYPERVQIPLLKDHHSHPLCYASCMDGVDIFRCESKKEAMDAIVSGAQRLDQDILIVSGWVDSRYQFESGDLDGIAPVAIFNLSLHGLVLNDAAKGRLIDQFGEEINRWHDRHWYERNLRRVLNCFAKLNASVKRLKSFYRWLEQDHGVVFAEEMLLVDEDEIQLFLDAELIDRTRFWAAPDTFRGLSPSSQEMVHGIKLFADGAIGQRTAALEMPYDSGERGLLIYDSNGITRELEAAYEQGKSVAVHAIGDRAIDQLVDCLAAICPNNRIPLETRIEHAQLISPGTARRAKELGVTLSMQPNFSADSLLYADRLPSGYAERNNPFRILIDEIGFVLGENLILGSDGMPHGVEAAVRYSLFPPCPDTQRLTLDEFKSGYCIQEDDGKRLILHLSPNEVRMCQ